MRWVAPPAFALSLEVSALRSLEEHPSPPGLSIPVVSVLDEAGGLIEADQRALVRFVIQGGYGADAVFAVGTTGEWNRIDNPVRQRAIRVCIEEVAKTNAQLAPDRERSVEAWAGITAHTPLEALENLECAIAYGADAAVLAPLSIRGVDDPVRFMAREVADLLTAHSAQLPVYLYDNPDIAADPAVRHIQTHQLEAMSRLDFVRGIKVSARREVLGKFTKAAARFPRAAEFEIYVGNAPLIFDLFRPPRGLFGALAGYRKRLRWGSGLPSGVVPGTANALPREWAWAWRVSRARDAEQMDRVREVLAAFGAATWVAGQDRTIACVKRALQSMRVISSAFVAAGTPRLDAEDAECFDEAFAELRRMARETIGDPWVSTPRLDVAGSPSESLP